MPGRCKRLSRRRCKWYKRCSVVAGGQYPPMYLDNHSIITESLLSWIGQSQSMERNGTKKPDIRALSNRDWCPNLGCDSLTAPMEKASVLRG